MERYFIPRMTRQDIETYLEENLLYDMQLQLSMWLPIKQVLDICHEFPKFKSCHDWKFWANRAKQDFKYPSEDFPHNAKQAYDKYILISSAVNYSKEYLRDERSYTDITFIKFLLNLDTYTQDVLNNALSNAVKVNNLELVEDLVTKGATLSFVSGNIIAHNLSLIKYFVENTSLITSDFLYILTTNASSFGRIDVIQYLVSQNVPIDMNLVLNFAASRLYINLVHYAIEHGATLIYAAAIYAAQTGRLTNLKYLLSLGVNPSTDVYNVTLISTIRSFQLPDISPPSSRMIKTLKYLLSLGLDPNPALKVVIRIPNLELVEYVISLGVTQATLNEAVPKAFNDDIRNILLSHVSE